MPFIIPRSKKKLIRWARERVLECTSDLEERIQRGALYRNMYLTGDENGNPATWNKTFSYIDNLASFTFSPLDLKYRIKFDNGGSLSQKSMGRAAAADMRERMRDARVYDTIGHAVEWSYVKGKTIFKLNWEDGNFAPYLIQPEFFGVQRNDISELCRQDCFTHTSYYTPEGFFSAFQYLPDIVEIMRKVQRAGTTEKAGDRPVRANALKQIVLGGLNPFQAAGNSPANASSRGIVDWLGGPAATFNPKVLSTLIQVDELWVKDAQTNEWATFHLTGDVLVTGGDQIRNIMADTFDPANPMRKLSEKFRDENPLAGMHPFLECAPCQLDGYFWGRSEVCNVGVLQMQINSRINGINRLLRRQENPPKFFSGTTSINQQRYSALDKPGAMFSDPTPNAKQQNLYPELPPGLWESLHELDQMFDSMSGLPPVLQGRGESGVRAQGHAETLTRNASPRFKDKALSVERFVADVGALALAYLRAKEPATIIAWAPPDAKGLVEQLPVGDYADLEPPAPGMKPLPFRYATLPQVKVRVDSHSSCPIFSAEFQALIFNLARIGAISPQEVAELVAPPDDEEDIWADTERRKIEQAEFLQQHPELLAKLGGGKKK